MTKLHFIYNALVGEEEIPAGSEIDVDDELAKGFVERGTAREAGVELTDEEKQSDALAELQQPHVVDQALANSAGGNPIVSTEATEEPVDTTDTMAPPTAEQLQQDFQQANAQNSQSDSQQ